MPNHRGIDVIQYECDRLRAFIKAEETEVSALYELSDLYPEDVLPNLVDAHKSRIAGYEEKLKSFLSKLAEYQNTHDSSDPCISFDPIEYLYQDFLHKNVHILLRKMENAYANRYNHLLSSGTVHFSYFAKKIASNDLYNLITGNIVHEFLLVSQIEELNSLPCYIRNATSAIAYKYEYFEERIVCCEEIGRKIRELITNS